MKTIFCECLKSRTCHTVHLRTFPYIPNTLLRVILTAIFSFFSFKILNLCTFSFRNINYKIYLVYNTIRMAASSE